MLIACSGTIATRSAPGVSPTPSPGYTPTPLLTPTTPPAEPTPLSTIVVATDRPTQFPDAVITPSPSPTPFRSWIDVLLELLQLRGIPPEMIELDDSGDATAPDGSSREISPDLDIRETYAGWVELPPDYFRDAGPLDCGAPHVLCTNDGAQPPEGYSVLGAMLVEQPIQLGLDRAGQVALIFDRAGFANSPAESGGFGGADLVVIGDLNGEGGLFMLEWKRKNGWQIAPRRGSEARIVIDGATVLFVVPTLMDEEPGVRFLTFERIPPNQAGAERMDVSPQADSFFDVFYEISPRPTDGPGAV